MELNVEVEVVSVNRVGAFPGNMVTVSVSGERIDVIELLLVTGHGYIHESFNLSRDRSGPRYAAFQQKPWDLKKDVWVEHG